MDPAATAVWPAGGRAYEAYEDYARSYLPVSGHPPGHPGTANLAWQPPQTGLDTERQHEDTKSGVLWSDKNGAGGGVGAMAAQDPLLAHQAHQWLSQYWNTASPWNIDAKMQIDSMENLGTGAYGRPQSSTSLSPPTSGLVVPQPLNARLPGQGMLGGVGVSGRKYPCKMCPQAFNSKADLQLHTQIHLREPKPYKCHSCGKAFANSSYLSQHTRIHLGIKPYRCEICQRKFTQLSHLQQHIRTHTGDKPYKCRIPGCTKAFSQLSNLQSHSRCHQTDKPHKCQSCYKCFADEAALLEHIPKHKESKHVKTNICPYCGKSYTQESYLAKHMQKHSDRMDKRAPVNCGPGGNGLPGLGADYWTKLDMSVYSYQHQLGDHPRLPELPDSRDYSSVWDPRNSSAFSPLQPTLTNTSASEISKPSAVYDSLQFQKQNVRNRLSLIGFNNKDYCQDLKTGAGINIPLSQLRTMQLTGADAK